MGGGEELYRLFPSDAGVGYGDAVLEVAWIALVQGLIALEQVTFQHHADDILVAVNALLQDIVEGDALLGVVLAAVGVRAVDHQLGA